MSRWHGKYGKGARRDLRDLLRVEADERNARTPDAPQDVVRALPASSARRVVCRRIYRARSRFVWHATAPLGAGR